MATMNISLPDTLKDFVETEVASGGYSTTSEYFRELLRDAQKRKAQEHLETLLLKGLDAGAGQEMTPERWAELKRRALERQQKKTA